jgi:membrane-associated phospholipid phosphatase
MFRRLTSASLDKPTAGRIIVAMTSGGSWYAFLGTLLVLAMSGVARAQSAALSTATSDFAGDMKYLTNNVPLDFEDVLTSPAYVAEPSSPFRSPRFYLELAGAGALWGGSFALDQTAKTHLGDMSRSAHDILENFSYTTLIAAYGLLYIYGLDRQNDKLRHYLLTGMEAAGMGVLANLGIKAAFGRYRPSQAGSHTAFFHPPRSFNTRSFTSNDMVVTTAMATGISEYYNNEWYVAAPVYSLALLEGFTRIGSNQQWFSDVVAGGLLGWGSAELLLWLHKRHEEEPRRWRVFPATPPAASAARDAYPTPSLGLGAAYSW